MSWTIESRRLVAWTGGFALFCVALFVVGLWRGEKWPEMIGFLLLAGTFIPLPFDVYVLHVVPRFSLWTLVIAAATLNTLAVLAERAFLLALMRHGRGRRVRDVVQDARLSAWFRRVPFLVIFLAGFTLLPFEPARFLAVVNGYSWERYAVATFLGRGFRFWLLVAAGGVLQRLDLLGLVVLVLLIATVLLLALLDYRRFASIFAPVEDEPAAETQSVEA